jgi:MerR family transcriptional regulator, mercuric resistance operon regulatory protein
MRIGAAAAASGCAVETIRYYERVGLLSPPPRTAGGYRSYGADDVARLRFIARGRELGFGLDAIRGLLALAEDASLTCDGVAALARAHLGDVRERIRALDAIAGELQRTIDACRAGRRAQCAILAAMRTSAPRRPRAR